LNTSRRKKLAQTQSLGEFEFNVLAPETLCADHRVIASVSECAGKCSEV
jgi:hypothetical protein